MAFVKMIRRRLCKPLFVVFIIFLVYYTMILMFGTNIKLPNEDINDEVQINVQRALEDGIKVQTEKKEIPLQPPDNNQIESQPNDKLPPPIEENIPYEEQKNDENLEIKIDEIDEDNENEEYEDESAIDDKKQINPPLKELPNVDVIIKEGLGENGKAVNINKTLLNAEDRAEYDAGWKNNAFNEFLSKRISLDRTLADPRDEKCKHIKYSEDLPDTSVIITFHNEAWTVLLRSVHSIINKTPEYILKEIILVDDLSHMKHLGKPLEQYMERFPKVKFVRLPSREGLIRARLAGYRAATGTVLVFLDSHIECAVGWIEPMLERIKQNWTTVVTPTIDVINDDTFEFQYQGARGTNVGGFDWNLVFTWHAIPDAERKRRNYEDHLPVRSPTMAGGLFAINREYFVKIGTYDDGMDIWGGENLEISFRIWMCGGTLETTPCSHVGHIFRKRTPYKWRENVNVLQKNNIRLAEVWLDEYKQYYYDRIGNNLGEYGNITSRKELRKNLNCKSFDWFLTHVYPEMWVPAESTCFGQIKAKTQPLCLSGNAEYGHTGKPMSLFKCSQGGQSWYLTLANEIKRDYGCFDYSVQNGLQVEGCHQMGGNQKWSYREDNTLYHYSTRNCLEISEDGKRLFMNTCLGTDYQIWLWNKQKPQGPVRKWNSVD